MVRTRCNIKNFVFVRLTIALIAGILLAQLFPISLPDNWLFTILILCIVTIAISVMLEFRFQYKWLYGCFIYTPILCLGAVLFSLQKNQLKWNEVKSVKTPLAIELLSKGSTKANSIEYEAKIVASDSSDLENEKLLLYISKANPELYEKHTVLYTNQYIQRISPPKNPHQFNYQKFMDKKGIHYQMYLQPQHILGSELPTLYKSGFISAIQAYCFLFIDKHIAAKNKGVAKALLLGYKKDLSDFNSLQFQRSGTMHILAVSGLHVGIIYLILQQIFSLFKSRKKAVKLLQLVLIIAGIWLFAVITGAKASVLRAACMFSLFAIGRFTFPYWNSINVLAAVAFLLLIINPNYLNDVGFQMSFSAVLGILLFAPFIQLFYTSSQFLNYFIGILCISLIAQLATLPFVLLYFHQFPTLGLIANLVAIPLTFAIVFTGFMGFLFAKIPIVNELFGWLLNKCISILNTSNSFVSDIKFAVIDSVYLTGSQAFLVGLAILCLAIYMRSHSKPFLQFSMFSLLLLFTSISVKKLQSINNNQIVFYSVRDGLIIDFIQGRSSTLFTTVEIDSATYVYSIQPNHLANYIQQKEEIQLDDATKRNKNYYWDGTNLFLGQHSFQINPDKNQLNSAEYIAVNSGIEFNSLSVHPQQEILIVNQYKPWWEENKQNVYYLKESGAYIIK